MLHYLELLYAWLLAPLGLYMLVKPPVRMLLCWLSLRSCIKTANEMNFGTKYGTTVCGAPELRSMLVYAMHPIPAKRGPTYAWYGFGNWQAWERAPEPDEPPGVVYTRTEDGLFEKGERS